MQYINCLHFASPRLERAVRREVARYPLTRECVIRGMWLGTFYAREIRDHLLAPIRIAYVSSEVGYGVFADEDLQEGCFIGEYVGEVKRYFPFRYRRNNYVGELRIGLEASLKFAIDAEHKGNITRFINHSYEPNLRSLTVIRAGMMHAIFVADRFIQRDSQLTYDYGEAYWKQRTPPCAL